MSKSDRKKRPVLWIVTIAVVAVVLVVAAGGSGEVTSAGTEPAPSREDYGEKSEELDYRQAMLEDYEVGTLLRTRGEVAQIFRETNVLLDTELDEWLGYLGEKVWLELDDKPRVLEGDVVEILARYIGTQKYESTLGAEEEVPLLRVDYIDVVE